MHAFRQTKTLGPISVANFSDRSKAAVGQIEQDKLSQLDAALKLTEKYVEKYRYDFSFMSG